VAPQGIYDGNAEGQQESAEAHVEQRGRRPKVVLKAPHEHRAREQDVADKKGLDE
jgi:hypothetical protein